MVDFAIGAVVEAVIGIVFILILIRRQARNIQDIIDETDREIAESFGRGWDSAASCSRYAMRRSTRVSS